MPKETCNSDKKKNNDAKSSQAAAFQLRWPERSWEEQAVIGLGLQPFPPALLALQEENMLCCFQYVCLILLPAVLQPWALLLWTSSVTPGEWWRLTADTGNCRGYSQWLQENSKELFYAFHGSCPVSLPTEVSQVLMPLVFYSTSVFVLQKGWRGNSLVLCESLNIFSKRFTEETCALSYWDCLLPAALPSLCWQYKHTHPCRCLSHSWSSVKPKDCSIHLLWPGPPGAALQSGFSFTTTCMNKRVQVQVGDGLPFPPYAVNWSLNILFGPVRTWERLWSVPQPHVPAGSLTPPADGPASLVLLAPC